MTSLEYLQQHTLDPDFVKRLGWEWTDEAITIPYYDSAAQLLFCKYRNMTGPKFSFDKGNSPALYAVHKIKNEQVVILCEGEADCARLWQEGIPAVTAGGVTAFNESLGAPLANKNIIVLLDNDKAGKDAIKKTVFSLENVHSNPKIAQLPENVKDICDFFANNGTKQQFLDIIGNALTLEEWEDKNKPEEFRIESGEEILKKEIPSQSWLIDRILPVDAITFIVGAEGTGKSFYTLTMAQAVTTGSKWLGMFEVKQQTKVLFIDKENVIRRIQSRMKGLNMDGKNLFWLAYPEYFYNIIDEDTDSGLSPFAEEIRNFVTKNDIGLIVIDSFTDVMQGNENVASDTQVFFDGIRRMIKDRAVLVIHHANKPSAGLVRTASQKTRGSSNIMAQVYSAFYVEQIPRKNHEYAIEHIKAGDTDKIKKFKVEMEVTIDLYDKSKSWVTGLRFAGEIEDEVDKAIHAEEIIIDALAIKQEMNRQELEELCTAQNISQRSFVNVLKKLRDENILDLVPDPLNKLRKNVRLI